MFKYPATELFTPRGHRVVVFSEEEHAKFQADGWLETQPEPTVEPAPELIQEPLLQTKRKR